jgi:hypothetical protein
MTRQGEIQHNPKVKTRHNTTQAKPRRRQGETGKKEKARQDKKEKARQNKKTRQDNKTQLKQTKQNTRQGNTRQDQNNNNYRGRRKPGSDDRFFRCYYFEG